MCIRQGHIFPQNDGQGSQCLRQPTEPPTQPQVKPRRALKRGKYFMAECHIDDKPPGSSSMEKSILGDPGADSGGEESLNRRENMAQKKSKERPEELFSLFFTFLRALFFRPFRLSLAPTICAWISEDGRDLHRRDEQASIG